MHNGTFERLLSASFYTFSCRIIVVLISGGLGSSFARASAWSARGPRFESWQGSSCLGTAVSKQEVRGSNPGQGCYSMLRVECITLTHLIEIERSDNSIQFIPGYILSNLFTHTFIATWTIGYPIPWICLYLQRHVRMRGHVFS